MKMAKWFLLVFSAAVHLHAIPWMFPETLLTRADPSTTIVSKIDSKGDAIAIWITEDQGDPQFSICESVTGNWTAPSSLDKTSASPANKSVLPALCMSEEGRAIAFWVHGKSLFARVFSKKSPSETWTIQPSVEEGPLVISVGDVSISEIAADMNASGDAVVVWSETKNNPYRDIARMMRYVSGVWESEPTTLYDDLYTDTIEVSPSIRINDAGDIVAAWRFHVSVVARWFDSNTKAWSPALSEFPFCLSAPRASSPKAAMDRSGDFYVAWNREEAIEVVRRAKGVFQPIQNLGSSNGPPEIAARNGIAIVVWPSLGDMIYTSVYSGSSWSLPMMISQIGAICPTVDIDENGNGIAVWENRATGTVQMADLHRGVWQTPNDLFPHGNDPRFATVSLSRSGNTLISWKTKAGTGETALCLKAPPISSPGVPSSSEVPSSSGITTKRPILVFGDPPSSPASIRGKRVRNHFGLLSEVFHEISWEPSSSPSVVGYQIFVYNKLVQQVPRDVRFFREHNKGPGSSVPYQVRAITAEGVQSHPLTIVIH